MMPVGTQGTVKGISPQELTDIGSQMILGNTYHLMLRPGEAMVEAHGGLPGFTAYPGPFLTDSGGFQVFSLDPKVDDEGVTFKSTYDGSSHRFTPETAVQTQELLGADIQMVLDVCPPLPSPPVVIRLALERTSAWAARAKATHRRHDQSLFGIVQGGISESMRAESAQRTASLEFDGYGIGGLSVGETRQEMVPALAAAGYYAVAPDLRGYGRTTGWDNSFDADFIEFLSLNQVRDQIALVHALGYRTVAMVVGHDTGAGIAVNSALIRAAALVSAPPRPAERQDRFRGYLGSVHEAGLRKTDHLPDRVVSGGETGPETGHVGVGVSGQRLFALGSV